MEINKIDDLRASNQIGTLRTPGEDKKCTFDKAAGCAAPDKMLYAMCRTCYRIDAKFIIPNIFKKIVDMASKLFNPEMTGPGQPPAEM